MLLLGSLLVISWLGLFTHNYLESVDGSTIAVGLVCLALFFGWWRIQSRRGLMTRLLLVLGLVQLIGAAVAVLPFGFLPFEPSQNLDHYAVHVFYGAAQLPLLALMTEDVFGSRDHSTPR